MCSFDWDSISWNQMMICWCMDKSRQSISMFIIFAINSNLNAFVHVRIDYGFENNLIFNFMFEILHKRIAINSSWNASRISFKMGNFIFRTSLMLLGGFQFQWFNNQIRSFRKCLMKWFFFIWDSEQNP